MRGEQVLGIAALVLAGVIATPALSAAQEPEPAAPGVSIIPTEAAPAEDGEQGTADEEVGSPDSAAKRPTGTATTPPAESDAAVPPPTAVPPPDGGARPDDAGLHRSHGEGGGLRLGLDGRQLLLAALDLDHRR